MSANAREGSSGSERLDSLVSDFTASKIDRRQFLVRAVGLGLSASAASALLAACGSSSSGPTSSTSATAATRTLTYRPGVDIANLDPAQPGSAQTTRSLPIASMRVF